MQAPRVLVCVLLWLGIVTCAAALWRSPVVLTAVFGTASVLMLAIWRGRRRWLMYACGLVLGPTGEIVAVYHGAWSYADAAWLIPPWLPPAWGMAALVLLELAVAIGSESPRR